ncbi:cellulose synthase subunit BcsC-related outer membrane protein [Pseudomonas sp. LS1212]|uniref:cellulose biosynthesis protein BcsC n=1 Tax=Pseudomonas sp. LS1212 TaxID=2972478 RepID=UPI00215C4EDD|nr:cellulose biosynthesis protein BcsC [Pseudomonas sp. LS1212]UVJ44157.1 cellulose synthase subunit BcsC-related outer membrane protein [Pseudomonas sp. LS1212]
MPPRRQSLAIAILAALVTHAALAETTDPQALLIEQGYYWQARNKAERATEIWQKLLRLAPDQVDALYGLGSLAVQQKRMSQAQDYLGKLKAIRPVPRLALQLEQDIALTAADRQQQLEDARRFADAEDREKAAAAYQKLFDGAQPQGKLAFEYYNNLAFTNDGWPQARQGLERLLRETPDDSIIALFLAKHLARREATRPEGIQALARLSTRPDIAGDADESWRLALVWLGAPSATQAPLFEAFLKVHPDDQEIRDLLNKGKASSGSAGWQQDPGIARGLKALDKGDTITAEREFQARLKENPRDADALGGLGVVRQQQNRLADAADLLSQAARQPGGSRWKAALVDVRYWQLLEQARDAQGKGNLGQARDLISQAMRLNPKPLAGPLALAGVQAQAGQVEAAEASYRQILARHPTDVDAATGLINVLTQMGKADEALYLLDSLPAADQSRLGEAGRLRAMRAEQMASAAEQRGDVRGAQKLLQDALRSDPDNVWSRFALARLYLKTNEAKKARELIDGLLKSQPNNPDALYTSALLSVELREWEKAQATLARIPASERTRDMNELAADIALNAQINQALAIAKRGQRQEAKVLLARTEPLAGGSPERLAAIASAYVDVGDTAQALVMMRSLLAQSPAPSAELQLLYAGVLLKSGEDVEVSGILRDLQGQPMSVPARKQYEDLLYLYRVRQAEQLREKGDLVAAYDTLSPALAQRPGDSTAVSALARMYSASGDTAKAFELYKPLVQRDPDNAQLLIGAADAAVQARDMAFAEKSVAKAVMLEPGNPDTLTNAARIYRVLGKSGEAAALLRKAVSIEQSEKRHTLIAQAGSPNVAANPFVGLPGQRRQTTAAATAELVPLPAAMTPTAPVADDLPIPAGSTQAYAGQGYTTSEAYAGQTYASALPGASGVDNPFAARSAAAAPRNDMSPAQRALNEILQERSAYVTQGLSIRSNNSESGLSKLTDVQTPLEANFPVGDHRLAVRVTPVSLNAGSANANAKQRFGGGPTVSDSDSTGSQKDQGVGVAVAFESPDHGVKADIGTTPMGFRYSTAAGGVSIDRPFESNPSARYGVNVSRRPVTDSLTSFAGTKDQRTGQSWGGVTANGARGQLSYDNEKIGAYGYGSWHKLLGNNVESNTRSELGSGVYWYLSNTNDHKLTMGVSMTGLAYDKNQDFFTYGHGGYFSPQSFFAIGVPVTWAHRTERFSYQVKGSVGVQHFEQDRADYFPNDKDLQASAGDLSYESQNKTSVGYSLSANGEYKFGSNFFLGGNLGLDNARDYKQFSGGMYLRYTFEDANGPMSLPVSPYLSPYSN